VGYVEIKATSIVMVPINKIIPNDKNNNKHSKEQKERAKKIFSETGFRKPLTISNRSGKLIAGHLRLEVAKELGAKELPCLFQDFKDEAEEYAHMTADNALASWSELDLSMVNSSILDLGPDFDIDMLGIKDFVIEPIEKFEPQGDEDAVPDVVHPITRKGDIWLLGNHRLMCGDSTMIDDVEKLMNGEKADMVFTSPPYNANTKAGQGDIFNGKKSKKLYDDAYSDNLEPSQYLAFTKTVLENCFLVTEGFIFWNVSYNANSRYEYIKQIENRIEYLIEQICWKKTSTIPFKGSLMRDWEPIYLFSTDGKNLGLEEVTSNHWIVSNQNAQQENHKACFPVALPEKGISIIKKRTGIVFEPFCGSGTTMIASEKLDRKCFGMELDEKYCDVIIARWQNYTGKKAILESTGQTYEELKVERDGTSN
jgi:DNA modification methylase